MVDLDQFAAEAYDAKAWINAACKQLPDGEMQERYLAELEMKLQLSAEDVEASLQDNSSRALARIPAAVQEVTHIKDDVLTLQKDVQRLASHLAVARLEGATSVAALAQLDLVKSRMEAAYETLKEATELSALFQRVETVFASSDVPAIAETLATMRRSLLLVGDVPEFKGGMERLEVLEDRFQALVEGSLAQAFAKRRGEQVQQLVAMMVSIGRSATVEKLYNAARLAPLQTYWDGFDPKAQSFAAWVPGFYDEALSAVEAELRWLAGVLPEQAVGLATGLIAALFARTDKSFRMRLSAALAQGGESMPSALHVLTQLQAAAVAFAPSLARVLHDADSGDMVAVIRSVYAPYDSQITRYGELEAKQLGAQVSSLPLPDALSDDIDTVLATLSSSLATCVSYVQQAAERCKKLTDNTEAPALLQAADQTIIDHVGRMQSSLHALRMRVLDAASGSGAPAVPAAGSSPVPTADVPAADALQVSEQSAAVLPLLNTAGGMATKLAVLDASLRATAADLGVTVEAHMAPEADPLHATRLRLTAHNGLLLSQLRAFVRTAADTRYQALPRSQAGAAAFQTAVSKLVYDVLMIKVKEQLESVAQQSVWGQAAPANEFNLPSFSAYPGPYVTAVGEYLMMLPTLLESVLTEGNDSTDDEPPVDGEWLDKVAAGAADLYVEQLEQIERLSPAGAQQLAADLEYFCNVLAALSVALPTELVSWQAGASFPAEEFAQAASVAVEQGSVHVPTLETVARKRQLVWPEKTHK